MKGLPNQTLLHEWTVVECWSMFLRTSISNLFDTYFYIQYHKKIIKLQNVFHTHLPPYPPSLHTSCWAPPPSCSMQLGRTPTVGCWAASTLVFPACTSTCSGRASRGQGCLHGDLNVQAGQGQPAADTSPTRLRLWPQVVHFREKSPFSKKSQKRGMGRGAKYKNTP